MPNLVSYIVLFSWPVVAVVLFLTLDRTKAIVATIVAGYLLLPTEAGFDLPMLPVMDKTLVPALTAGLMCILMPGQDSRTPQANPKPTFGATNEQRTTDQRKGGGGKLVLLLLSVLSLAVLGSVVTNQEPLQFGPTFLPNMRIYDAFSVLLTSLVMILPFLIGWRYLNTPEDHRQLLSLLALAGVAYSLLALFEVRMSPQLNLWLYGFFPHSFDQHIRGDGFRPIIFLEHGLWVGIFFTMATLSGAVLWRSSSIGAGASLRWFAFLAWMLVTLFLIKSLGALVITLLLLPVILFGSRRLMTRVASVIAIIVLVYPVLRGLDWVPVEEISELANKINEDRAASFDVRVHNENILLERAEEKPFFGWGGWGRNEVYDPETGRNIVIIDGLWIIFIGTFGWIGYVTRFGILTFPILALLMKGRKETLPVASCGLSVVLAANLIDLLPNATQSPITWLIAGSLLGYAASKTPEETGSQQTADQRDAEVIVAMPKHVRKPRYEV